jgi:hypothetical protein
MHANRQVACAEGRHSGGSFGTGRKRIKRGPWVKSIGIKSGCNNRMNECQEKKDVVLYSTAGCEKHNDNELRR